MIKRTRQEKSRFAINRPATKRAVLGAVLGVTLAGSIGVAVAQIANASDTVNLVINDRRWVASASAADRAACHRAQDAPLAGGGCTLRAAVVEANSIPNDGRRVVVTVNDALGTSRTAATALMTNWPSSLSARNNLRMVTTSGTSFQSSGILFNLTRDNITIDLDDRLWPDGSVGDPGEHTLFHIAANGIQLLNMTRALSSGTSFAVGQNTRDTLIDGAANCAAVSDEEEQESVAGVDQCHSQVRTVNWAPERFVLIREGAQNVTVRGFTVSGFYDVQGSTGLFMFQAATGTLANPTWIRNVEISDIDVVNPSGTGTCSGSNGSGCRARLTNFIGTSATNADRLAIENLTFRDIFVQGMNNNSTSAAGSNTGRLSQILDFTTGWNGTSAGSNAPLIRNLTIEDSVFANNAGQPQLHRAVVALPPGGRLEGNTIIRNNLFSTTTAGRAAINIPSGTDVNRPVNSTAGSNIFIYGNHFDGFNHAAGGVHSWRTGLVTVEGNTFSRGGGAGTTAAEETNGGTTGGNMFRNRDATSNQNVRTWIPTGTASVALNDAGREVTMHEGIEWLVPDGAGGEQTSSEGPTCAVQVSVRPEGTPQPSGTPAVQHTYVDVFWTGNNRAEMFVGRVEVPVGSTGEQLRIPLPVGRIALPGTNLPAWITPIADTTAVISNPITGALNGHLRLQTHFDRGGATQLQSSQLSRTVPLTGNCAPALTINQAATQGDPTMARFLEFDVTSTRPLISLPAEAITLAATPTSATIDASRINERVVSIAELPDGDGQMNRTRFRVTVSVDDSALVRASIPAGAVQATAGLPNLVAATSHDNEITFINPITATPTRFSLITGRVIPGTDEKEYLNYLLSVRPTAPLPTSPLEFTTTVVRPDGLPELFLTTSTPTVAAGATTSGPIGVRAEDGDVAAGTEYRLLHTLQSLDARFDGLVVPSIFIDMFSTDPFIRVVRTAYINVPVEHRAGLPGGMADPAAVMAHGLPVPTGSRLAAETPICFVWTVTNVSRDDWTTHLTGVEVWDTDDRLGTDGLIGTVPSLQGHISGEGEYTRLAQCTVVLPGDTRVVSIG